MYIGLFTAATIDSFMKGNNITRNIFLSVPVKEVIPLRIRLLSFRDSQISLISLAREPVKKCHDLLTREKGKGRPQGSR